VKKLLRAAWVLVANGIIVWLMFTRLFGEPFNRDAQTAQHWLEFLLEAALPILGIVIEFANLNLARWVNVGYLVLAGCFWLAEALWWRSDPFHGAMLIIAIGLLTFAGLTEIVYRMTRNDFSYNR
jgi:hypothetical protein